ncbi:hypothetical protein T439DRAFT_359175 [Meredithblackwellia eburnea MCA 4105]
MSTIQERAKAFRERLSSTYGLSATLAPTPSPSPVFAAPLPQPSPTPTSEGLSSSFHSNFVQDGSPYSRPQQYPNHIVPPSFPSYPGSPALPPPPSSTINQLNPTFAHPLPPRNSPSPTTLQDVATLSEKIRALESQLVAKDNQVADLGHKVDHAAMFEKRARGEITKLTEDRMALGAALRVSERKILEVKNRAKLVTIEKSGLGVQEAYNLLKVDSQLGDEELVKVYESLLLSDPNLAPSHRGAFLSIFESRNSPATLVPISTSIITEEIKAYLSQNSIQLPLPIQHALEDPTGESDKEKTRAAKLDAKIVQLKRDLDSKISEVKSWRLKAEKLMEEADAAPTRKVSILRADLEREKSEKIKVEQQVSGMKNAKEKAERAKDRADESLKVMEKKLLETEVLKTELATQKKEISDLKDELEILLTNKSMVVPRPSSAPKLTSIVPGSSGSEKYVINKLAETVKTLSAELTSKTAENAELMIRLASLGEV